MKIFLLILAIVFVLAVVVLGPIATILALNVLFSVGIEISFKTWLAMFWIQLLVVGVVKKTK